MAEMGHRSYVLHSHVKLFHTAALPGNIKFTFFRAKPFRNGKIRMRPLFLHLTNVKKFCFTTAHPIFEMVMTLTNEFLE